jgi:replicative DNA helicase
MTDVIFEPVDALSLERLYRKRLEPVRAVPTHLPTWNVMCRDEGGGKGLARGWHITIGGASGTGKSLFALNLAVHAARAEQRVGYVSLEMSFDQLVTRSLAILSGELVKKLEMGDDFDEEAYLRASADWQNQIPNRIVCNRDPIETWLEIKEAMGVLYRMGCRFYVIDYIQLAWVDSDSILKQITEVSHGVRKLAHKYRLITIGISQFNRDPMKMGRAPRISDLMGGGPLEQDSDQVLLLDFTSYKEQGKGQATQNLLLAKNRHGPVGKIPIAWDYGTLRVYEVEESDRDVDGEDRKLPF